MSDTETFDEPDDDIESISENELLPQSEENTLEEDVFSILEEKTRNEKLAWCIDEYFALQTIQTREEDSLYVTLTALQTLVGNTDITILNQIKKYCDLQGLPIGLFKHERFQGFLQGLFRTYFKNHGLPASPQNLLELLGFPRVKNGAEILISDIEATPIELSNPDISLQTIQGNGIVAFQRIEGMLEYVLSFYGRWLAGVLDQRGEYFIDVIKQYVPNDKVWVIDRWHDQRRIPSISEFITIIRHWNGILKDDDQLTSRLEEDFPSLIDAEIIQEDQLDELSNLNEQRSIYAHSPSSELPRIRKPKYRQETQRLCLELLRFARYLRDNVIPKVVLIQRMTNTFEGLINISCLCEDGTLKQYNFRSLDLVPAGREYFLHLRTNESFESDPIDEIPILMPVEFRRRK